MSEITYINVLRHLETLKEIYQSVGMNKLKSELKEIERIIGILHDYSDTPIQMKISQKNPKKKSDFLEIVEKLFRKEYASISGIKQDYSILDCSGKVVAFIEQQPKTKVINNSTLLDLKLLFCILTGELIELKGKKEELYDAIKANVRAKKTGDAFGKIK